MDSFLRRRFACFAIASLFLIAASASAQTNPTSSEPTTFVFIQKTDGVAKFGSPRLFPRVVDDLQQYLKEHQIATVVRTDDLSSGAEMPVNSVQEMARNSGAKYLLHVIVDRPTTKWLKLTVACYDAAGQQVWTEESSAGREFLRHNGEQNALQRLHQRLDQRLGQPGLPRTGLTSQSSASPSGVTPAASQVSERQPAPDSIAAN